MRFIVLLSVLFTLLSCGKKKTPADLVIEGGKIYTMSTSQPTVEAVAVAGNKIVYAGTLQGVADYKGEQTKVFDLKGKTMTPGFIEGHGHIMGLGYNEMQLDLMDVKSYDEMVERVREAVAKAQPGQWILGR
ncbi:MAG: amidohydrolase family protein, partial [Cytophagales bacterium]